jgi:hypothetical protein
MTAEKIQHTAKLRATPENVTSRTRRSFPAARAVEGAFLLLLLAAASYAQTVPTADAQAFVTSPLPEKQSAMPQGDSIRPFHISVPDEQLVNLRQRLAATRWPDKETVTEESQGIRLAEMQALVHYWGTDYDWRKVEATLNALPEFVTKIDGVDIRFIHVLSRERNALPLILTHGWPGERARQIGGKLEIWSRPEAGTEIELSITASIAYRTPTGRRAFRLFRRKQVEV